MDNNQSHYYKQFNSTEIAVIIFIIINIINLYVIEAEKKQLNGVPPRLNTDLITEIILIIAIFIYIFFVNRDINELEFLMQNPQTTNKKINNQKLRIVVSMMFLIAGIIFLYIEVNDKNVVEGTLGI